MKVGVTVDQNGPSRTTLNILSSLKNIDLVEEVILLRIKYDSGEMISRPHIGALMRVETCVRAVLSSFQRLGLAKTVELSEVHVDMSFFRTIELTQVRKGWVSYTRAHPIRRLDLDIIVRGCGLLIERGELLEEGSKMGLFGIHFGDNRLFRGGPGGFWECYLNHESLGMIFQKYTMELDGGHVICRANLRGGLIWSENNEILEAHIPALLEMGLRRIAVFGGVEIPPPFDLCPRPLYRHPKMGGVLRYLLKSLRKICRHAMLVAWSKFLTKCDIQSLLKDNWQIMIFKNSARIDKPMARIPMNQHAWYADPFYSPFNDGMIVCEKYYRKTKKATIVAFQLYNGVPLLETEITLIDNGKHASYPYTFQIGGNCYFMVEEGTHGVNLYEFFQDSGIVKTKFVRNILPGGYVEPSVVMVKNEYWVFANRGIMGGQKNILDLFITTDILDGILSPCAHNPILIDSKIGRGAGRLVLAENRILRPAQDGLEYYGKNLHFTSIDLASKMLDVSYLSEFGVNRTNSQLHHFDYWEESGNKFILMDMNKISARNV